MKKLLVLIVLGFMMTAYGQEPQKENSLTKENLKGRVSSLDRSDYTDWIDETGEVMKHSLSSRIIYKYDEQGNEIEMNNHNSDGSLRARYTYKYDEQGNEIEQNIYNSDGSLSSRYKYKYDEQGNEIEQNIYNSDGSLRARYTVQV